jgi:enoyl-CoA hydratase/3-hydroxyacyl-CoA dehydrogenase
MTISGINKIVVIGAGIMGHGIAQLFAMYGYRVNLVDINDAILEEALNKIGWSLDKLVEKKLISRDQGEKARSSINIFPDLKNGLKDVDFVLETVTENLELKHEVYRQVCRRVPENIIIASNTSDLRITRLALAVANPARFVGMHFLNPPPLMPLVEIVMGEKTSAETAQTTRVLAESLGKMPIVLKKDRDLADVLGWIFYESLWQLEEAVYTQEEIDASFRAEGFPMGMIELLDFTGLDTAYNVIKAKGLEAPPVMEEKIRAGNLGKKSGHGFYDWSQGRPLIPMEKAEKYDVILSMAPAVNEAAIFLEDNVCTRDELDQAFEKGQAFPYGPFKFADTRGIDAVCEALRSSHRKYRPHPRLLEMVKAGRLGKKSGKGFYDYES